MKNILREQYGLGDVSLSPIAMGNVNLNVRVDAPGGSYVLKRYDSRYFVADEVRRTCEVQVAVGRMGVPVPAIIPNRAGELLTLAEGGLHVLFAFVPGRHHHRADVIPIRAAFAMGETLGRLLKALQGLLPPEPYALPDPAVVAATIERILQVAERGTEELDRVATQSLRAQLGAIERLAPQVGQLTGLAAQWIHGDYQETNVIFDADDQVAAIVDFDNLRMRPRGWELMRAMGLCFPPGSDQAEALFRGYARIIKPEPQEVALYVPLWSYVSAAGTWPMQDKYLAPERYQPRWDRFIRPRSDWWEQHGEAFTRRLLAIAAEERKTVR